MTMTECWRCGVDFDATPYLPGAPCPDCQWDFPGEEFRRFDLVREQEAKRVEDTVVRLAGGVKSDSEIADLIGVSSWLVRKIRNKHGIPTHMIPEGAKYGYKRYDEHHPVPPREKRPTKLSDQDVAEIKVSPLTYKQLAAKYGVSIATIYRAKKK